MPPPKPVTKRSAVQFYALDVKTVLTVYRAPADDCDKIAGPCNAACDGVISDELVRARFVTGDSEYVGSGYPLR